MIVTVCTLATEKKQETDIISTIFEQTPDERENFFKKFKFFWLKIQATTLPTAIMILTHVTKKKQRDNAPKFSKIFQT